MLTPNCQWSIVIHPLVEFRNTSLTLPPSCPTRFAGSIEIKCLGSHERTLLELRTKWRFHGKDVCLDNQAGFKSGKTKDTSEKVLWPYSILVTFSDASINPWLQNHTKTFTGLRGSPRCVFEFLDGVQLLRYTGVDTKVVRNSSRSLTSKRSQAIYRISHYALQIALAQQPFKRHVQY